MISPNTIPPKEYAQMLFEAARKVSKRLQHLQWQEEFKMREAEDKGDNEKALKHYFRGRALQMAYNSIIKSPSQLEEMITGRMLRPTK